MDPERLKQYLQQTEQNIAQGNRHVAEQHALVARSNNKDTTRRLHHRYMRWLSTGVPDGAKLRGAGTLQIKGPDRSLQR